MTEWLRNGDKKTLETEMPELRVTLLRSVGAEIEPGGAAGKNGVSQNA